MKKTKVFSALIIMSIIYLSLTVNSAFVIKDSEELINAYKNQNLVRLHVIANSNSPEDQYLKRKLRDEVIKYMADLTEENLKAIEERDFSQIKRVAEKTLVTEGVNYPVEVSFGNYYFPKRTYGNFTLPEGQYNALKIVIGEGEGSNWWCVLLPPLCVESEKKQIATSEIEIRFKLAEFFGGYQPKAPVLTKNFFNYKLIDFQEEKSHSYINNLYFYPGVNQ